MVKLDKIESVIKAIAEVKVKNIKIYDTKNITPLFDYAVIATAPSSRQLNSAVEHLKKKSIENDFIIKGIEGARGGFWALIDLGDILVNIFIAEEREKYELDKVWKDLPQLDPDKYL